MRVLLVGSGGREHALAWKLAQSPRLRELHAVPGNPGIGGLATLHAGSLTDLEAITNLAVQLSPDLVVVGPEAPLAAGLADRIRAAGLACFGPSAAAARLESSKAFAKGVMQATGVPTAQAIVCDTVAAAQAAIAEMGGRVVVKADGLAAGKGVIVCDTAGEAQAAAEGCLVDGEFGQAGQRVLIEERMEGPELSLLALCDGEHVVALAPARDHKRALDGDLGPNTGGMGAFSPVPGVGGDLVDHIVATVHRPVVNELARLGTPFRGCLYAGLMLTAAGPRVIEFNVRFGDPEAQVIMPRLDADLLDLLSRAAAGSLTGTTAPATDDACVTVVVASRGYPEEPETGANVAGIAAAEALDAVMVFHAGTAERDGGLVASGGRVLNVTACGRDFSEARERAYAAVDLIHLEGSMHRTDIALGAERMEHVHA
jgi:phosphoribosylamine---glycine ligase